MKKFDLSRFSPLLSGLLIAITPVFLPVCEGLLELENGKTVQMRCFWTERAVVTLGILILLSGVVLFITQSPEGRQRLNHLVALMGLAVILTPLFLIPTCANPDMACNLGAKPAWLILGSITFMAGLWGSRTPNAERSFSTG